MAKIIVISGHHPAEATSINLARDIARGLAKLGHDVKYHPIRRALPKRPTIIGWTGSELPLYAGTRDFRDRKRSDEVRKVAEQNPDCLVFDFHNYQIPESAAGKKKEMTSHIRDARASYGGIWDPKSKAIIYQHTPESRALDVLPNLFTVEIPSVTKQSERFSFPIANRQLSEKHGFYGEHVVEAITLKINRIVSGKKMSTVHLTKRKIVRRKIRIK